MNIFARTKAPVVAPVTAPVPIMTGFKVPRLPREKKWVRRGLYALLAVLCFVYSFFMLLLPMQLKVPFAFPLILMVMLIVWALPTTNHAPGPATARLFWAYTISLLLWPNYLAIALPGLPWITAARLFATPMLFIILVNASSSLPFKTTMRERLAPIKPLWILVAIFAVIQVVSVAAAPLPIPTFNRVFNNEVMWTGMFFAAIWVLGDEKRLERWIIGYVIMVFILGLMSVWEARLGRVIWANSVPAIFQIEDESVQRILSGSYRLTGQYRVQTTATTPLSFAELMVLSVPFILYLMTKYPRLWVICAGLLIEGLIIYGLIQADARLGFVGLIIGHVLYLFYFSISRWQYKPNSIVGAALVSSFPVMLVLVTLAVLFVGRIRVRVLGGGQHESSNEARIEQMHGAFDKIWSSPILGFGSGNGATRVGFTNGEGVVTIDSYYLMVLMDYGFVGFIVYYGMLIYAIYLCGKISLKAPSANTRALAAVIGIFTTEFLVIKSVLAQEANHPLAFVMLGAVATVAYSAKTARDRTAHAPKLAR